MKNKRKLKYRFLLPVVVAFNILIFSFYFASSSFIEFITNKEAKEKLSYISMVLNTEKEDDITDLTNSIFTIQNDINLRNFWMKKDRASLYKFAKGYFDKLSSRSNVTFLNFIDKDGYSFLQTNTPEVFGEKVVSYSLSQTMESQIITSGFEVDELGKLTLRVVIPWFFNGNVEGYITLGENIDNLVGNLHLIFNFDLYLLINKDYINLEEYFSQEGGDELIYNDKYQNYISVFKTNSWEPDLVESLLLNFEENNFQKFSAEGKEYISIAIEVLDTETNVIGEILLFADYTEQNQLISDKTKNMLLTSFAIGATLFVFIFFYSDRIEKKLFKLGDKAIEDGKLRELQQKTYIDKLLHKERKLKESEARFKQIAKSTKSIIWEVDKYFNFIYLSPTLYQVLGYNKEDLLNKSIFEKLYDTERIKEIRDRIRSSIIKSGEFYNIEARFRKKDGEIIWLLTSGYAVTDEEGSELKIVGSAIDITDKKETEIKLVEAKEKAERADKLKSTFLAQMTHEVRTPINSIVSLSSIIEEELAEHADDDLETCFNLIQKSGDRIIRTTDLILNLSEIEAGSYELVKGDFNVVDRVLNKLINQYSSIAKEKNIKLELETDLINPIITADLYTIEQIFSNLIDNAIKYTDEGDVVIRVFEKGENKLTIEIIDSGIGISEEYLPKLFTPFSQEVMGYTRKYEGNGIGLTLVKKYCDLNNVEIEVESIKGVGSTFRVRFGK